MDMSNERNCSMDLARVAAAFMVICAHVTSAWKYGETATFKWHASEVWDAICRSGVPLFFMMSGAFYKDAPIDRTLKRIVKFIVIFFGTSLAYAVTDSYWSSISGGGTAVSQIINGIVNYKYHLWYLPAYIFVISIAPIIVKVMDGDDGGLARYLIGIWIVFGIIPNTITTAISGFGCCDLLYRYVNLWSSFVFLSGNHVGYFIIGRYLSKNMPTYKRGCRHALYIAGVLATAVLFFLTDRYSHYAGNGDVRWYGTLNVFILLQAVSLFVFFWNINITGKNAEIASGLSKYILGIYLVHVLVLEWNGHLGFFPDNGVWKFEINPILNTPIRVVLVFAESFLCVFILKKIKNVVGDWLKLDRHSIGR